MEDQNMYAAPNSEISEVEAPPADDELSSSIVSSLRRTRPWVLFLTILGVLSTGIVLFGGLALLVFRSEMGVQGPFGALIGIGYLAYGVLLLVPIWWMARYAIAIGKMRPGEMLFHAEQALDYQRKFWRTVGIMAIIFIILYLVLIALLVTLGTMG